MKTIPDANMMAKIASALLLGATLGSPLCEAALTIPPGGLTATKSGNDLFVVSDDQPESLHPANFPGPANAMTDGPEPRGWNREVRHGR